MPCIDSLFVSCSEACSAGLQALRGILQRDLLPVPQPAPEALRLLVLADIMTADSFLRDKLFVQYTVSFDPCIWRLAGSSESATPAALSAGALKVSPYASGLQPNLLCVLHTVRSISGSLPDCRPDLTPAMQFCRAGCHAGGSKASAAVGVF